MCTCISVIGSENGMVPLEPFKPVEWVDEGMQVLVPIRQLSTAEGRDPANAAKGMWCVVATAAGTHARVVNAKRGVDQWFHLSVLARR